MKGIRQPMVLLAITAALFAACAGDPVAEDAESGGAFCTDGLDNDADGSVDCQDPGCDEWFPCCFGRPVEDCCIPATLALDLDFSGCAGDPTRCVPEVQAFGNPGPRVEAGGLVGGGSVYDGGIYSPDALDANTSKLVIDFEAASRAADCTGECLDAIGVALTTTEPRGAATWIRPAVGLLQSASRRQLSLLIAGRVVQYWEVDDSSFHRWRLELSPDGQVGVHELDAGGRSLRSMSSSLQPRAPSWLTLYGRAPAEDPAMPASRARRVEVRRSFCFMPQSVVKEPDPVLPAPGAAWAPSGMTIQSAALGRNEAGQERLAFEYEGAIHLAREAADGSFEPVGALSAPVFTSPSFADGGIGDPWLVADEEGDRWVLYYSAVDAAGTSSIGHVLGRRGFSDSFDPSTARIVANDSSGLVGLSQPTVLADLMVVKAVSSAEPSALVTLRRTADRVSFAFTGRTSAESQIRVPDRGRFAAFDRDEVGHPALVEHYMSIHLLFGGRRGTRWHVGLMVSKEGTWWRDPLGEEALMSGSGSGFDSLGVIAASGLEDNGGVRGVYLGSDGALRKLGRFTSGGSAVWPAR